MTNDARPEQADEQAATPAERPRPAYGEYAPEGWHWTPPGDEAKGASDDEGLRPGTAQSVGGAAAPDGGSHGGRGDEFAAATERTSPRTGRVPGVPHNLGARPGVTPVNPEAPRPAAPAQPASDATPREGTVPTTAPTPEQASNERAKADRPPSGQPYRGSMPPAQPARKLSTGRLVDRIATVILLVFGALGALNTAASLYGMPSEFRRLGSIFELTTFAVPEAVGSLGTVGALVIFAIYALNLIYSLQRLRAKKITFWVPLVAAVIAGIVGVTLYFFAVSLVPELLQAMSDPTALQTLLDSLSQPAR